MRRICTLGVCVLAVVALGAVAAGSAAAASPEYVTCAKAKNDGKYSNKTCSEANAKGEGKYERVPLTKATKVKGTVGTVNIYLYEPKNTEEPIKGHFECKAGKYSGSITNSHEGTLAVDYSECAAKGKLSGPCHSPSNHVVSQDGVPSLACFTRQSPSRTPSRYWPSQRRAPPITGLVTNVHGPSGGATTQDPSSYSRDV